jgi:hypothetical protein
MSLQDSNKINITQSVARKTGVYTIEFDEVTDVLQVKRTETNGTVTEFRQGLSASDIETLKHFIYNPETNKLEADRAIETTLNSLFLGEQHKMSSGAENIFFTNLGNDTNFYPMWGGLKDQSLTANQGPSGFIPPSGRVYTDMFSLPLRGNPDPLTSVGYSGGNYFGVSIAGLGITTTAAEEVDLKEISLEYLLSVNGKRVYKQVLPKDIMRPSCEIYPSDVIEWFFDHPVEIHAGTTIFAEIRKISLADDSDLGVFQVREGDTPNPDGSYQYQAIVHNRLFEDKDLELISPYLKYKAMDFGLEDTGSTILLRDLSLGADSLLVPYAVNTLEAVANGTEIKIKVKGGAKVVVESLPVSDVSIDGFSVNSVLNQAVVQLNSLFTNVDGFASGGNPVIDFVLSGNDLTITLDDLTSFTADVTTLGVDENNHVVSGALDGSDLVLTMTDGSEITIDASNMINGSTLPAITNSWYISYGSASGDLVTVNHINNNIRAHQPFYNGQYLYKGHEMVFTHKAGYDYIIGVFGSGTSPLSGTNVLDETRWEVGMRYINSSGRISGSDSSGIDLETRYDNGDLTQVTADGQYDVNASTVLAIRYTADNYLRLLEITGGDEIVIAQSTSQLVGDYQVISFGGHSGGAIFPSMIYREERWTIVHDYDNSETGIYNNIEDHTVLRSNISLSQGQKYMIDLDMAGRSNYFGTSYTLASSGNASAEVQLENRFTYGTSEQLLSGTDWTLNTSAANYDPNLGAGAWRANANGVAVGMVSMRYLADNTLELWSEAEGELIMTCDDAMDGNPIHLYFGVRENTQYQHIPNVSRQDLGQGTQPITTYAPNVPDQVFYIEEGGNMNAQLIVLDYIVNQWVEVNAPSWITMNQNTGVLSGVAPSWTNSSADAIVINCKAANAIGGTTNFTVTVNVYQATYVNSKSVRFDAGQSSYFSGNSSNVSVLQRTGNPASGSTSDAWTIAMWVKRGDNTGNPYFSFGSSNNTDGYVELRETADDRLRVRYGTSSNYIQRSSANNTLTNGWNHVAVVYTGGPTGNYEFAAFKTYINGTLQTMSDSSGSSSGFSGNIGTGFMYVGRFANTYLDNGMVDQLAIWGSDKSADIADLYNSGVTQNLEWTQPDHYYEFGDSVTTVNDVEGNANLTGFNLNVNDLITDTP